jgi:hypothetical protein
MKSSRLSLLLVPWLVWATAAGPASLVIAAEPAPWPQANGPTGNFNPLRYGHALVDDLNQIRQVWLSADNDLGFCKGSSSGYASHLADPATHPGTGSGLIVAEGKVFASSFQPAGDVWAENHPVIGPAVASGKFDAARTAALKRNSAIDADDLTVAVDLKSGKTLWKSVERGRGVNRYTGKRLQMHATPAYSGGRVFSLGTTGAGRGPRPVVRQLWLRVREQDAPDLRHQARRERRHQSETG